MAAGVLVGRWLRDWTGGFDAAMGSSLALNLVSMFSKWCCPPPATTNCRTGSRSFRPKRKRSPQRGTKSVKMPRDTMDKNCSALGPSVTIPLP